MDCADGDVERCPNQGPAFPTHGIARAGSGAGLEMVTGVELSLVESLEGTLLPTGHVGCLPRSGAAFASETRAFVDRPAGTIPGSGALDWCHEVGGLAIVNHPFALAPWIEFDWTGDDFDGLEIYNGGSGFDMGDQESLRAWMCDVAEGRQPVAVGASDSHMASAPSPPEVVGQQSLGWPSTWLWTEGDHVDELLGALASGRTVVADPWAWVDLRVRAGGAAVGPGDSLRQALDLPVEVRIEARARQAGRVVELLDLRGACVEDGRWDAGTAPVVEPQVLFSAPIEGEGVWTVEVEGTRTLVARVWPEEPFHFADGVAISAPIWVVTP